MGRASKTVYHFGSGVLLSFHVHHDHVMEVQRAGVSGSRVWEIAGWERELGLNSGGRGHEFEKPRWERAVVCGVGVWASTQRCTRAEGSGVRGRAANIAAQRGRDSCCGRSCAPLLPAPKCVYIGEAHAGERTYIWCMAGGESSPTTHGAEFRAPGRGCEESSQTPRIAPRGNEHNTAFAGQARALWADPGRHGDAKRPRWGRELDNKGVT